MAAEAGRGLLRPGQKTLPCKLFYDEVGTLLFEAICALPEYGLTAADSRLLRVHAEAMVAPFRPGLRVAELGSGNAMKTRWLLQALCHRQRTQYLPIEISPLALARCQQQLRDLAGLEIQPLPSEYLEGLEELAHRRGDGLPRPLLVLFLGSTLGNFDPPAARAFLAAVRRLLLPGDGLLLGLDLVKPAEVLRRAYDDPSGVTAAFNLNLLARLNRELGADFDLRQWQHRVRYAARVRRIEMHLRSRRDQVVQWPPGVAISFRRGETIWTESSHKFEAEAIGPMLAEAGFVPHRQWRDTAWPFAETLGLVE
ncbi:MAG: L-histidine N(alpha)-methyltransferase [Terriglobales bacterium]